MLDQGNRRGREASRGSAPWIVRLLGAYYFCGGSIVNSEWIITAAHCITEFNVNKMNTYVHVADHDNAFTESEERLYRIKTIVTHADFNDDTYDADIAMIKLDTPISNFTHYVRPICLPTNNLTERIMKPRKRGRVSGWGRLRENGPTPRFMNEFYVPVVAQRKCISSTTYNVTDNMFCAGYKQKLTDACTGDSGGPFSILYENRWYLFGIVSWGEGCGQPGKYGFYTRISAFLDWITNVILEETLCPPLEPSANVEGDCNRLWKPGQVCNFRCTEGHVRTSGDVRRVCRLDGTWSGNELLCEDLITKPTDVTLNTGDTLVFSCLLADDLYSIVWEKDGDVIISNEHTDILPDGTLLINGITPLDDGKYTCAVMARVQEESAILTVQSKGNIHHECGIVTSPEALQEQKNRGKNRIRLLNGRDAARGSAPWMVRLYYIPNQKDICGGSIVNSEWIVTAAHCVNLKEKHKNSTLIRVADHDSEFEEFEEKNYTIGKIVRHPDFNQSTWDSDIAMIKLETPISQLTDYVRPICLPTKNIIKPGKLGRVNGWGITSTSNITHPRFMNEIYVPVVSQRKCISSTNATFAITRNMFCAGYAQETTDACYGDSGGPFSVFHEGRWYLSGIVSWGEGCGEPGKYGFYTRISAFRKWIKNVMRKQ